FRRVLFRSDGGAPTALVTNESYPRGIAIDDAFVYWVSDTDDGGVGKVAKDGGARVSLAKNQGKYAEMWPWTIAVDDTAVYFVQYGLPGGAVKVNKDGTGLVVLAADQPNASTV